jgi:hypothetical protein
MNELGESFSSFDERKSLENELSVITEIFRNRSLSITTIKDMQLETRRVFEFDSIEIKRNE